MNPLKFSNISKGTITTLLGVVVILASVVSVFYPGTGWAEAVGGLAVGVTLLGLPDPKQPGAGTMMLVAMMLTPLTGCVTYQRCQDKYGVTVVPASVVETSDSVKVPVTVTTKADSIKTSVSLDSLSSTDTTTIQSAGGLAILRLWKSDDGTRLNASVTVPPQVIHDTVTKYITLRAQCPPVVVLHKPPSWWQRHWHYYQQFCTVVVSLAILAYLALLVLRRR